ncbi:MAG: site-specific DNA-methyltransferase [Nitrospira sp.]|nr:site-specific DNA-methyltransferase [Nitrospira sp.]
MSTREEDFDAIKRILTDFLRGSAQTALLAEGDSLSLLRNLPNHCVSLILTDPPYHTTKKKNIYGDTRFKEDECYLDWMRAYAKEWKRVLRPNGSLLCFCASEMSARLELLLAVEFNILSQVVWTKPNEPGFDGWKQKMKKESLRQWYAHTERIVFAEPACEGNLMRSPFGNFLKTVRKKAGLSTYDLCAAIGAYGKVNHGGSVSNWEAGRNVPSREQYQKLCDAILATQKVHGMPPYENAVRPFVIDGTKEFTDVWTFPSVRPYKGKHPAEKPAPMLEHAISATTFPDDIVLDCFAGSGSTAVAAARLGRRSVSMEIDPKWVRAIASSLQLHQQQRRLKSENIRPIATAPQWSTDQFPLFVSLK